MRKGSNPSPPDVSLRPTPPPGPPCSDKLRTGTPSEATKLLQQKILEMYRDRWMERSQLPTTKKMKIFWILAFLIVFGYFYGLNYYYKLSYTPAHPGVIKIKSEMSKQEISTLWIAKTIPEKKIK